MSLVVPYVLLAVSISLWIQTHSLGTVFLERLRTRYPDAFEGIPKPARGMVQYGPLTKAQMSYIDTRGYRTLGDGELERLGARLRVLQRLYVGSFVLFILAFAFQVVLRNQ